MEEVQYIKAQGYNPYLYYQSNEHLREVIDLLRSGFFAHGDRDLFRPLVESLLYQDDYLLMADYQSYIERQDEAGMTFLDKKRWTRMSILNTARMGKFSSDRAIQEYCQHIWQVKPTFIELQDITLEQVRLNI